MKEETYQKYLNEKFNGVDTPENRAAIRRTVLDDEQEVHPESAFNRPEGMSTEDWYRTHANRKTAANWNEKQRREIENESREPSAKQMRIELIESKIQQERANPNKRKYYEKELEEAKVELAQEQQEQAAEAREVERRNIVEQSPVYQRAIENANATYRMLSRDNIEDEARAALIRLERLRKADPDSMNQVIQEYWLEVKAMEDREALREQSKAADKTKVVADAVQDLSDQEARAAEARQRANNARSEIDNV